MSHVSSVSNSSYPYRGTLSRLDSNGDGLLSLEERSVDERPGILEVDNTDSAADGSNGALSGLIAKLMQLPNAGTASTAKSPESNVGFDLDLLSPMDAYNSTYGQYDVDSVAA
ncbi:MULTISPECIES: hypothetical protein [Rhizobium]|uniref:Uncharacterized protein n=1 Tax=Rhizobium tropici TaxID=398 RepID=A0A329YAR7_RHITR|nr:MULTISPECIES: hypothetical protein [Rhizobium]MBB3288221.1 hypothetical protein [Rhizobium sp. BK252]MBB3402915.1 hypothetical protein [Rhizobium sp. BK289]MBB3415492.1 hypothetical protein [Rhizobium sp. BK284]MBB3483427.1 hypothetical protein [Rhizobium sp. BK347]MDK4723451.1 hypothetical protein [Rhizobium sp. CNPSo 3968]